MDANLQWMQPNLTSQYSMTQPWLFDNAGIRTYNLSICHSKPKPITEPTIDSSTSTTELACTKSLQWHNFQLSCVLHQSYLA